MWVRIEDGASHRHVVTSLPVAHTSTGMDRRSFLKIGAAASLSTLTFSTFPLSAAQDTSEWPTFRQNLNRTGHISSGTGPKDNVERPWNFSTDSAVLSSPTVAGESLYIGSDDAHLYALNIEDGTEQWSFETGGLIRSTPTVKGNTVYFGSFDGQIYAVDASQGTERWSFDTGTTINHLPAVTSSPAVVDQTIYVGNDNGTVYAISADEFTERWRFPTTDDFVNSSPAVANDTIYVASGNRGATVRDTNGHLHALDVQDGSRRWVVEADGSIQSSPAVVDETVCWDR